MGMFDQFSAQLAALPRASPQQRGGLLGGLQNFLASNRGEGGFVQRLNTFGAQLQDIDDGGNRARQMQADALARQQAQQTAAARAALNAALIGGRAPAAGGAGDQATAGASGGALPSLRSLAPALIAADQSGIDVGSLVSILDKSTPNMQFVNGVAVDPQATAAGTRVGTNLTNVDGTLIDTQDPTNANRFVPQVDEGQELLRDAQGGYVVRDIPNYVQSLAGREAAVVGAREGAQAPYRFVQTQGPNGEPMTIAVSQAQGGAFAGQAPAQRERAIVEARGAGQAAVESAERARVAPGRIERYLTALDELPNAITGFGAEQRLGASRAGALVGVPGTSESVAATETYRNLTGQDFGQLLRDTLGGAANFSNADRDFLQQLSTGNIELNPRTLERVLQLNIQKQVDALNASGGDYAIRVTTPAQAQRLPRGARFQTPDGQIRVRQ